MTESPPPSTLSMLPATDKPVEEFKKTVYCAHCRRDYLVRSCHTRANTLLTETQISCPRCRRKLKKIRLKDWYDHYVHAEGQPAPEV